MPLYIRDDAVDALAEEARRLTHAKTKTEAVRRALEAQIAAARTEAMDAGRAARSKRIREAVERAQRDVAAMGTLDLSFDMKAFMDDAWGES